MTDDTGGRLWDEEEGWEAVLSSFGSSIPATTSTAYCPTTASNLTARLTGTVFIQFAPILQFRRFRRFGVTFRPKPNLCYCRSRNQRNRVLGQFWRRNRNRNRISVGLYNRVIAKSPITPQACRCHYTVLHNISTQTETYYAYISQDSVWWRRRLRGLVPVVRLWLLVQGFWKSVILCAD